MKKLSQMFITVLLACCVTEIAQADVASVSFSFNSTRSYYACNYLERQGESMLEALGADQVSTTCRGGLPNDWWISGTYSFRLPQSTGEIETVQLRVRESCDFNEKLIAKLLTAFDVVSLRKQGSCWDSSGNLRYTVQIRR